MKDLAELCRIDFLLILSNGSRKGLLTLPLCEIVNFGMVEDETKQEEMPETYWVKCHDTDEGASFTHQKLKAFLNEAVKPMGESVEDFAIQPAGVKERPEVSRFKSKYQ